MQVKYMFLKIQEGGKDTFLAQKGNVYYPHIKNTNAADSNH